MEGQPLDCHLLFPPPWSLLHCVHLSLPLLTGHLKRRGYRVVQTDLNQAVARSLLSPEGVREAAGAVARRLSRESHALDDDTLERLRTAVALAPVVIDGLAGVARALRDASREPGAAIAATQLVQVAGELVSAATPATVWDPLRALYRSAELSRSFTLSAALASVERGHLDLLETALRRALRAATAAQPARLYGLGVACSEQLLPALRCARWIREQNASARIVIGGAGVPFLREAIYQTPAFFDLVDHVVIGDGEEPLAVLLEVLATDGPLERVPNLHFRANGTVRASEPTWNAGFEAPAVPCFEGMDLDATFAPKTLPLLMGRRCYWNRCAFCSITYDKKTPFGPTRTEAVLDAMHAVSRATGCSVFSFVDEAVSPPQLRRLSEALLAAEADFTWEAMMRFEAKLERTTFERARRAGMRAIYFGLESGSQRVVDLMEKGFRIEVAERCLRDAHQAGIWTGCFVMVGFPGEGARELAETVAFCERNRKHLDSVSAGMFEVHACSPAFENPKRFGLRARSRPRLGLDHRLSEPERSGDLQARCLRFRSVIEEPFYRHLDGHAVNAGNVLHHLRAGTRDDLVQRMGRAEERCAEQSRRARESGARLRFAPSVLLGAPKEDAVAVFGRVRGGLALLPASVVTVCRAGTTARDLRRVLATEDGDPATLELLVALGLLEVEPR